jgi:hypothetical protein
LDSSLFQANFRICGKATDHAWNGSVRAKRKIGTAPEVSMSAIYYGRKTSAGNIALPNITSVYSKPAIA